VYVPLKPGSLTSTGCVLAVENERLPGMADNGPGEAGGDGDAEGDGAGEAPARGV
jgi:hypothetical protein